jgi:GR25 family glycosyltransferase involved in LPS biosynthesis
MRIYAVNCDAGRATRLLTAAQPLDLDIVLVPSPLANDPEVLLRGQECLERKMAYPTGIAATLGHLRAMQLLVDSEEPWGIVIEDDVRFRKDFKKIVARLEAEVDDADIISLGFVNFPSGPSQEVAGVQMNKCVGLSNPWGAQCYMITRNYAKHLVETFEGENLWSPYHGHFVTDWVLFDPVLGCRRHTLMDPIAIEDPSEQTIAGSTNKPDILVRLVREDYSF